MVHAVSLGANRLTGAMQSTPTFTVGLTSAYKAAAGWDNKSNPAAIE